MISTGAIRKIDDLGRIQIPRDVRKKAFGRTDIYGKPMEIFYEADGTIILKPYNIYGEWDEEKRKNIFAIDLCTYTEENVPVNKGKIFVRSINDLTALPHYEVREEISELIEACGCEGICGIALSTMDDVLEYGFTDDERNLLEI